MTDQNQYSTVYCNIDLQARAYEYLHGRENGLRARAQRILGLNSNDFDPDHTPKLVGTGSDKLQIRVTDQAAAKLKGHTAVSAIFPQHYCVVRFTSDKNPLGPDADSVTTRAFAIQQFAAYGLQEKDFDPDFRVECVGHANSSDYHFMMRVKEEFVQNARAKAKAQGMPGLTNVYSIGMPQPKTPTALQNTPEAPASVTPKTRIENPVFVEVRFFSRNGLAGASSDMRGSGPTQEHIIATTRKILGIDVLDLDPAHPPTYEGRSTTDSQNHNFIAYIEQSVAASLERHPNVVLVQKAATKQSENYTKVVLTLDRPAVREAADPSDAQAVLRALSTKYNLAAQDVKAGCAPIFDKSRMGWTVEIAPAIAQKLATSGLAVILPKSRGR
jgi:hypothetical protein